MCLEPRFEIVHISSRLFKRKEIRSQNAAENYLQRRSGHAMGQNLSLWEHKTEGEKS